MTLETKYLIDLSDVIGLEFECRSCHAKVELNIDATRMFYQCPACNADFISPQTQEDNALRAFISLFKDAESALQGRPFSLRMRVNPPPRDVTP
jgi:hypothetical protein